jgi:PilZ domain
MESSENAGRDRRRHERFEFDGSAEVISFHPESLFRGAVRDISLTGCYVETRARLNLKRFAEVELRFSANGHQLTALARVMDVRPGKGIGVEFVPGDPRMNKRFRDLIEELKARSRIHAEREMRFHGGRGF